MSFTVRKTDDFDRWLHRLRDRRAKAKVLTRIDRAQDGNLGDHRSVGGQVSEMRIDYGPGYRVYYTIRGDELLLLLVGGDKSSQPSDIEKAKRMVVEIEE